MITDTFPATSLPLFPLSSWTELVILMILFNLLMSFAEMLLHAHSSIKDGTQHHRLIESSQQPAHHTIGPQPLHEEELVLESHH